MAIIQNKGIYPLKLLPLKTVSRQQEDSQLRDYRRRDEDDGSINAYPRYFLPSRY